MPDGYFGKGSWQFYFVSCLQLGYTSDNTARGNTCAHFSQGISSPALAHSGISN